MNMLSIGMCHKTLGRPVTTVCLLFHLAWGTIRSAQAQPGSWDATFARPNVGGNTIAMQADGKILTGGMFSLTRLNLDGSADPTFPEVKWWWLGQSGFLSSLAIQADGKILLGGEFDQVQGQPGTNVARLNPDGTPDPTFRPPSMGGFVQGLAAQPDGAILIGGRFNLNHSTANQYLARLRPDGSLDNGFRVTSVSNLPDNDPPLIFALQPDGGILIGGIFSGVNGVPHTPLARLNADGSVEEGFQAPAIAGTVSALALQLDGKIVVVGALRTGTNPSLSMVRLEADGTLDPGFNPAPTSPSGQPVNPYARRCIAIQNDGRILIGAEVNGGETFITPLDIISRLLPDGRVDSSFQPDWLPDIGPSRVAALALQTNGQILIGGSFPRDRELSPGSIARLNGDAGPAIVSGPASQLIVPGSPARLSVAATGPGPLAYQWQKNARNLVGETNTALAWTNAQAADTGDYAVLVSNPTGAVLSAPAHLTLPVPVVPGSLDTAFAEVLPLAMGHDLVGGFILQPDGNLMVTGYLLNNSRIWQLNSQGGYIKTAGFADGSFNALALQPDGRILVSFLQSYHNGNPIFRLNPDGTTDPGFSAPGCGPFSSHCGLISAVCSMAVQSDGKVVLGGPFVAYDQTPLHGLARLNTNGSLDTNFHIGAGVLTSGSVSKDPPVTRLVLLPDDRILFTGTFTKVDTLARTNMARLHADGSADDTFDAGPGANGAIVALALDASQRILIGGEFTQVQGLPRNRLARLLPDGQVDTSFDPGAGADQAVSCLAIQADGKVWIGGRFTNVNGSPCNHIAKLNPDGSRDTTFNPGTGAEGPAYQLGVYTLALQPNGDLLIGGNFSSYNGVPRNGLARLHGDPVPPVLRLSNGRLTDGGFSFLLQGISGGRYAVQTSTNLTDWQGWTNVQLTGSSVFLTQPEATSIVSRFFRAVAE